MGRSRPAWPETEVEPVRGNAPLRPVAADAQAFAALYREFIHPIYQYCYRRLRSVEDAEDATSIVFAKALATFSTRRDESAVRSWLFAIAHNVVADHYRTRRQVYSLDAAAEAADPAATPEMVSSDDDALGSLLARLPAEQARILELQLAGLTGPEIAAVLGKSLSAVKVARFRAYARLREVLGGQAGRPERGGWPSP
jgi:RNA polymerase sigma-70 factor (ECF subfamily)